MSRRHKKGHGDGEHGPGMERWLLTYADMITLLLALFVILFALSTINAKKFKLFEAGLNSAFDNKSLTSNSGGSGLLPDANSLAANGKTSTVPVATTTQTQTGQGASPALEKIAASVTQALRSAGLSQYVSTEVDRQGVVVQMLADKTYFATDSATLGATGDKVVDTIATVLKNIPNDVEIQGYTDDEPVLGGTYSSNWELSAVRAVNVVRRLVTVDGISKGRLSATAFATTHPLQPNTTTANKAENRRVDVVILTSSTTTSAATTPSKTTPSKTPSSAATPSKTPSSAATPSKTPSSATTPSKTTSSKTTPSKTTSPKTTSKATTAKASHAGGVAK